MLRLVYSNGEGFARGATSNLTQSNFDMRRLFNSVREYSIDDEFPAYVSNASNSNKTFNTAQYLQFTIGGIDTTKGFTIFFNNENCVKIKITLFTGSTIFSEDEINVSGDKVYYLPSGSYPAGAVINSVKIDFLKTKNAGQKITVNDVTLGNTEYIEYSDFLNIELIEEYNILSTDLPINELDFTVKSNTEIEVGKKVSLYSNDIYFGTFYIDSVQPIASGAYECVAYNSLILLEKVNFEDARTTILEPGQDLKSFIVGETSILSNSLIISTHAIVDYKTKTNITDGSKIGMRGFIPIESFRKALCRMCWAIGYSVDSARSDVIFLKKISTQITKNITDSHIVGQSVFKKSPIIKTARYLYVTNFDAKGSRYNVKISPGTNIKKYYEEPPGVPFAESFYNLYSLHANWFSYSMSGTQEQTIEVFKQGFSKNYATITNPLANDEDKAEMQFADFECVGMSNMTFEGSSPIYSYISGTPIYRTNDILKYIQSKGTVQARVILDNNPIKPGDLVTINTAWQGTVKGIITKMTTHFGYQDVADVEIFNYE